MDKLGKRGVNMVKEKAAEILQAEIDKAIDDEEYMSDDLFDAIALAVKELEQEPQADYREFAEWVAKEVFSDIWELNKDSFQEIVCRKLAKLGLVETEGDNWVLKKGVEEWTRQ